MTRMSTRWRKTDLKCVCVCVFCVLKPCLCVCGTHSTQESNTYTSITLRDYSYTIAGAAGASRLDPVVTALHAHAAQSTNKDSRRRSAWNCSFRTKTHSAPVNKLASLNPTSGCASNTNNSKDDNTSAGKTKTSSASWLAGRHLHNTTVVPLTHTHTLAQTNKSTSGILIPHPPFSQE